MIGEEHHKMFLKLAPRIYGRYWKTHIAKHLSYTPRTISNWVSGRSIPPISVIKLLQLYLKYKYRYNKETNKIECYARESN